MKKAFQQLFMLVGIAVTLIGGLGLAGCASAEKLGAAINDASSAGPVAVADKTTLDESALTEVEMAYKVSRLVAELLVDAGLIRGETAATLARLDRGAYLTLAIARGAYATGNAKSYAAAIGEARATVTKFTTLLGQWSPS